MKTERKDVYAEVTNQIIAALESCSGKWERPWHQVNFIPKNAYSGLKYRGINTVILWLLGQKLGYQDALWATYRQWSELGAQVRKGEKSATVLFWKSVDKAEGGEAAEEDGSKKQYLIAKYYHVFNVSQVENHDPGFVGLEDSERLERAEGFFSQLGVNQKEAESAFYVRAEDTVYMPPFSKFLDREAFYSVLSHEVTHWSGHESRLNRDLSGRFGDQSYAIEELIAELGSAFLCAELEVKSTPRDDHAEYIAHWLQVLKADKKAIFSAASKAQQAVDWMIAAARAEQQAA